MEPRRIVTIALATCLAATAAAQEETPSHSEELAQVTKTLETFFAAPNVEELTKLVRDPERVGPLMTAHYKKEGFALPKIRPPRDLRVTKERGYLITTITMASLDQRPVVLERQGEKLLVDWESLVGYGEVSWSDISAGKAPATPALLRARAKPSDYFNYDFTEDEFVCLQLTDLKMRHTVYGYVSLKSDLLDQLAKLSAKNGASPFTEKRIPKIADLHDVVPSGRAPAASPASKLSGLDFVTIRVQAPKGGAGKNQVEITEILETGWILGAEKKGE